MPPDLLQQKRVQKPLTFEINDFEPRKKTHAPGIVKSFKVFIFVNIHTYEMKGVINGEAGMYGPTISHLGII